MKISIVTVCYNAEKTIERTIQSVFAQIYSDIEYIIVDGLSSDSTMEIVGRYADRISLVISEKDNGMYDALNKGIRSASGDIVGIMHADDAFMDNDVLARVASSFKTDSQIDAVIGDIVFVNEKDEIIRYYSSRNWTVDRFAWGYMPPHPSFYCRTGLFRKYGYYRTDFDIAADYELLLRFFKVHAIKYAHIPGNMVAMKTGGKSTSGIVATIKINREINKACKLNGLDTNYVKLAVKYFFKVFEFIRR